jgi:hypothetical protein
MATLSTFMGAWATGAAASGAQTGGCCWNAAKVGGMTCVMPLLRSCASVTMAA